MNNQKSASPSSLPLFCILLASLAGLSHPCSHMWPVASLSFMTWVLEGLLATCVVCMGCSWNQPAFTIDMLHQCLCLVPTALPSHSLPSAWCHAQNWLVSLWADSTTRFSSTLACAMPVLWKRIKPSWNAGACHPLGVFHLGHQKGRRSSAMAIPDLPALSTGSSDWQE